MTNTMKEKKQSIIDRRMVYIMPSIVALAIALTSLLYQFGDELVDLQNTCYYLYFSPHDEQGNDFDYDESMMRIKEVINQHDIAGYTLHSHVEGGYKDSDGIMNVNKGYELILMDISKKDAYSIAEELGKTFDNQGVMVEEVIMKHSIVKSDGQE